MVERCVRDAEAAGSSPVTSTMLNVHNGLDRYEHSFLCTLCCSFFIILNSRFKLVINIHTIFSESRQAIYAVEMTIPSNECILN